jgi:8-oxo-dGTP pyrophosphatase MutT (NUDIX family)
MKDSRYEVIKHILVCENSRLSVFFDTIKVDGKIAVEDYMSISPKTKNEEHITGVLTLPISNGKYGLLQVYRPPISDYSWELPGGFMEPNESPVLSAQRELKEETGLVCKEEDLIHLGSFYPVPGLISGKACIFSAEKCLPVPQAQQAEFGISQFKWFSEEEVEDLITKGSIHDMATVLAIHRRIKLLNRPA